MKPDFKLPDWRKARVISTNKLDQWQLVDEMFLPLPGGKYLHVKAGFVTDCASIPRIARIFYTPTNPKFRAAAIGHDALYASEILPRDEADNALRSWMKLQHNNAIRRGLFYAAVRAGGGFVWGGHSKASIAKARAFVDIVESPFQMAAQLT